MRFVRVSPSEINATAVVAVRGVRGDELESGRVWCCISAIIDRKTNHAACREICGFEPVRPYCPALSPSRFTAIKAKTLAQPELRQSLKRTN